MKRWKRRKGYEDEKCRERKKQNIVEEKVAQAKKKEKNRAMNRRFIKVI